MSFESPELSTMVTAGSVTATSARIWARGATSGTHRLVVTDGGGDEVARLDIELELDHADGTGAWWLPTEGAAPLRPDTPYTVELQREGQCLGTARFRTAPSRGDRSVRRWSFGAFSCHQPFDSEGKVTPHARSMLRATLRAYREADVRFVLMMGDQTYADLPKSRSLFDPEYFARVGPAGRSSPVECTASQVRALYQQRHRIFFGVPEFAQLMSSFGSYPMPDDHEFIDNFGSDPAHEGPGWEAVREGALDAFFDYQGSRVHERDPQGRRPSALDWGIRWGPAAIWGLDIRSHRKTVDGVTTAYLPEQLSAMRSFFEAHADASLMVVMTPIPLVHVSGRLVTALGQVLGEGSDLHERWSHPQCVAARDRLLSVVLEHHRANPHQRIVMLGGDVHAGATFQLNLEQGAQIAQLTSSALSNQESWLIEKACEVAAHSVDQIEIAGEGRGSVSLIEGLDAEHDGNPFGGLNAGIIDVYDHGDRVNVGFRLVTHDGEGNPVTAFHSGELGRRGDPARAIIGVDRILDRGS